MPLLTAVELASMRTEQSGTLPDTCTIQTCAVANVKGSWSEGYSNTYTNVACRLAGVNQEALAREMGAEAAAVISQVLTLAYDQAIGATDRVVHNSITYEVVAPANADASWKTAKRIWLKVKA